MSTLTLEQVKTIKTLNNIAESGLNVFKETLQSTMIVKILMQLLFVVLTCIQWNSEIN